MHTCTVWCPWCRYTKHANNDIRLGKPADKEVTATLTTYPSSDWGRWHTAARAAYATAVADGKDLDGDGVLRSLLVDRMPPSIKALYAACHPPRVST
jgi:hypothetical protein